MKEITLEDGAKYIGELKDNIPNGKGKKIKEVSYIEGEFINGHLNGYGKEVWEESGVVYEGDFLNDQFDGEG